MEQARAWVRSAMEAGRPIVALTGAGISAESGVPTFRGGKESLWRNFAPEDLATPEAFARDSRLVWEWYDWRRRLIAKVEPNAGHRALAALEQRHSAFALVTQNVDGLHDRAGSRRIHKVHGDIWRLRCTECAREWTDLAAPLAPLPPRCECGAIARPGVVWFGEALPWDVFESAAEAARRCAVMLVIGTSAAVYPAAGLAPLAKRSGARVIEVNVAESGVSAMADAAVRGPAAEMVPRLIEGPGWSGSV